MDTVCGEGNKLENMSIGFCWIFPTSGFTTLGSKSLAIHRWQRLSCSCPLHQIHRLQSQNQSSRHNDFHFFQAQELLSIVRVFCGVHDTRWLYYLLIGKKDKTHVTISKTIWVLCYIIPTSLYMQKHNSDMSQRY